jgi:hypothetical protein
MNTRLESGLGTVRTSNGKQPWATTSNDTIAATCNEHYQCRSQQEAPKPWKTNTLKAMREAGTTNHLDATGQPCQWTQQKSCESAVSIRTKRIPRQQLSSQGRQLTQRLYAKTIRRPFLDRKPWANQANSCLRIPYDECQDQQKQQKQAATNKHSRRNTCTMHHTWETHCVDWYDPTFYAAEILDSKNMRKLMQTKSLITLLT